MALSIGIVGLPNVGKSTLFNALTNAGILAANYPFTTIEPNTGIVPIPDPRVDRLAEMFGSSKRTNATVTFVDIAGLVEGASKGEGLGNQFLANIREVNAICHVVRAFESANVAHVEEKLDPARDIEVIETELAIADLETIDRRLPKMEKEMTVDKSLQPVVNTLRKVREVVAAGEMVSRHPDLMQLEPHFSDLHLLTAKPVIYVFNMDETGLSDSQRRAELADLASSAWALFLDAQIESELIELEPDDRLELLESIGQTEPGLDAVVRAAYDTLGLQSFLTANENEARAWTIRVGATAPEAAGVIHTDFQRGFIAAEVISFDALMEAGSWAAARSAGLVRTEGKSYVMRPSDVVQFRFNV
ncbi:MAG TPA: redox-regulated ATPase YchF [Acidimicrobiia bacterium]|nr:redox-regulated ATPase YchF [Acidimicrobiia bacterium]